MKKLALFGLILSFYSLLYGAFHLKKQKEYAFLQEVNFFVGAGKLGVIEGTKKGFALHIFGENYQRKFLLRRGEGPSEVLLPAGGFFQNQRIYILDRKKRSFLIFNEKGKFQGSLPLTPPHPRGSLSSGYFKRKAGAFRFYVSTWGEGKKGSFHPGCYSL